MIDEQNIQHNKGYHRYVFKLQRSNRYTYENTKYLRNNYLLVKYLKVPTCLYQSV